MRNPIVIGLTLSVICGALAVSGCQSSGSISNPGIPPSPVESAVQNPMAVPGPMQPLGNPPDRTNVYSVQLKVVPSKMIYSPGEPVQMEITLSNASTGNVVPITVEPYPPVIYIVIPGGTPESNKLIKTLPAGSQNKTLTTGEQASYPVTWDQKDDNGKQVSPGWYYYEGKFNMTNQVMGKTGTGVTDRAFLIQYPQGAMQKLLELNQSQTVSGFPFTSLNGQKQSIDLVLTLKSVELSEKGASFLVAASSPNNPVSGYNNPQWSLGPCQAQYVVDGAVHDARAANTKFLDSGIELRWGSDTNYLDPVPSDATQLTFVITRWGEWQGRVEFPVPLK